MKWILLVAMIVALSPLQGASTEDIARARELRDEGKTAEAIEMVSKVVAEVPEFAEAYALLGDLLLADGNLEKAEENYVRSKELGNRSDAITGLAQVRVKQERFEEAKQMLDEAQANGVETAPVFYSRGVANAGLRQYAPAAQDLERSLELNPSNAIAHYYAGLAYNSLKRPDKMVEHFQIFLKMAPEAPEAARVRSVLRSVR